MKFQILFYHLVPNAALEPGASSRLADSSWRNYLNIYKVPVTLVLDVLVRATRLPYMGFIYVGYRNLDQRLFLWKRVSIVSVVIERDSYSWILSTPNQIRQTEP